jgi:hypothetical protein
MAIATDIVPTRRNYGWVSPAIAIAALFVSAFSFYFANVYQRHTLNLTILNQKYGNLDYLIVNSGTSDDVVLAMETAMYFPDRPDSLFHGERQRGTNLIEPGKILEGEVGLFDAMSLTGAIHGKRQETIAILRGICLNKNGLPDTSTVIIGRYKRVGEKIVYVPREHMKSAKLLSFYRLF